MAVNQTYYLQGGTATVAAAGTIQSTATALVKQINTVTVGTTDFGVILPLAYGGDSAAPIIVKNSEVSNNLKVYPPVGGTIDGGSANAAIDVAAGQIAVLYAKDTNDYVSLTGTITATQAGYLASLTPGTVTASKAVVVDSSKNIATFGTIGSAAISAAGTITGTSASASALAVGRLGATTPALKVDASAATQVTGLEIVANAAASGVAVRAISSGTDETLNVNAKGAGLISVGGVSTGLVGTGIGSAQQTIQGGANASLATQNITPTAAQLLGGYISHASTTGAGTNTLPLASLLDTALGAHAVTGATLYVTYANTGSQTVTLTTNTGWTLVGTVAVGAGKNALLILRRTGSGTWDALQIVSA